jgi:hypothetical protein
MWENGVCLTGKLMKESWKTETSIEIGYLCILLLLALKRPLRKKNYSDDWPVP